MNRNFLSRRASVSLKLSKLICWSVLASIITFFGTAPKLHAQPTFQGLGALPSLPRHIFASQATGVSADGSVIVGTSDSAVMAFRWTSGTGMVGLGVLPGCVFICNSDAWGVSADGSVIVGSSGSASIGEPEAFRWTSGTGMVGLGVLPVRDLYQSTALGVSADGSVIVGFSAFDSTEEQEAFRWTSGTGMVDLGVLPGCVFFDCNSQARGVSADGSVIVGYSSNSAFDTEAFRWTSDTGMVGLGSLPGSIFFSVATAVSADGSVVVGYGSQGMFRWTSGTGMVGLGNQPGAALGLPWGISADGSTIVGTSPILGVTEAFIWDVTSGMRRLQDVLVSNFGLNLAGWVLEGATGISSDGLTIVGYGVNPSGNTEAWIARLGSLPQPTLTVTKSGTGTGTVSSTPSGINCGSVCAANYNSGTTVHLWATPDPNMDLKDWTGDNVNSDIALCNLTAPINGVYECDITMSTNRAVTANFISLLPAISVSPSSWDFSTVTVGNTKDKIFTVQNTGGGTLTGTASTSAPFSIVGDNSFNLGSGESKDIKVRFSPTSAVTFNGNVNFSSNGGNVSPIVTGTGVPAVTIPTAAWATPPPSTIAAGQNFTVAWTTTGSPTHVNIHWNPTDPLAPGCCLGAADTTDSSTGSPSSSPMTLTAPTKNPNGTPITTPATAKYVVHVLNALGSGNSTVVSVTVGPQLPSDLIIQNLAVTPTNAPGASSATVSFTIRNQGSGTASPSITNVRMNTSSSSVATSDALLASISTPSIAPGEVFNVTQQLTIPSDRPLGTNFIWIILDVNSTANQSNQTNDKANTAFTVTAPSELAAPALILPADGSVNQSTTPNFTWTPVTSATSYRIMVAANPAALPRNSNDDSCPNCLVNTFSIGTSFLPPAGVLNPGATYSWQVKAIGSLLGRWSNQFSFSAAAPIVGPVALSIIDPDDGPGQPTDIIDNNGNIRTDPKALEVLAVRSSERTGIVADGVSRLILRVESAVDVTFDLPAGSPSGCVTTLNNQTACDLGGARPTTVTVPVTSTIAGKKFALALYVAPDGVGDSFGNQKSRNLDSAVTATPVGELPASKPLSLWWPPVVLLHGLWGSEITWEIFADDLSAIRVYVYRPEYQNDAAFNSGQSFDANIPVGRLAGAIAWVRYHLQNQGIAVAQVDVVGHSMGGLVARAYTEYPSQYKTFDNFKKGYIHKLITVDTPHGGTPLADFVRTDMPGMKECRGFGFGGAFDDLRVTSHPLTNGVGATVPTHAIGVISNSGTGTETDLNGLLNNCVHIVSRNHDPVNINQLLADNGNTENDDTVVRIDSQVSNLVEGQTSKVFRSSHVTNSNTRESIVHSYFGSPGDDVGAPNSMAILPYIKSTLLVAPATPPLFTQPTVGAVVSAKDSRLRSPQPDSVATVSAVQATIGSLDILEPAPGTVGFPGDQIVIQAAPTPTSPAFSSAIFVLGNEHGTAMRVINSSPFEVTYQVPSNAIGKLDIWVGATDIGGQYLEGSSFILVNQLSQLEAISVEPSASVLSNVGATLTFAVRGTFGDGVTRNITSVGTTYRTLSGNSGVVEVTSAGLATAKGIGSDVIVVENNGLNAALNISVVSSAIAPVTISASSLPAGEIGATYNSSVGIAGGIAPFKVGIITGTLPAGLSIDNDGRITGIPTKISPKKLPSFTVNVTDQLNSSATRTFKMTVLSALHISTKSLKAGTHGKSYKRALSATGGKTPYTWSLVSGSLPSGLSLNSSTGAITGTPTQIGSFNLTFKVTDALGGQAQKNFTLTIK